MKNFPLSLGIHISKDCNLRCPGCYLRKDTKKNNFKLMGKYLKDFASKRQVWVAINSGHINPDKDLKDLGLKLYGLTTTPDILKENKDIAKHFKKINLSFDAYKRSVFSLKEYTSIIHKVKNNVECVGLSVISYQTNDQKTIADEIAYIYQDCKQIEIHLNVYLLVLKGVSSAESRGSVSALLHLQKLLYNRRIHSKMDNCLTLLSNCEACEAGSSTIDIEANGDVSSCSFLKPLGNIFRDKEEVMQKATKQAGPCNSMKQYKAV
jgi:MoaA/NifB/PqqE/SkfB family radical SAM enzyme